MISNFEGKYEFLSNFYPSPIIYNGITFPTNEHFFQAMKTYKTDEQKAIAAAATPGIAKRLGRKVTLRSDWEKVKFDWMEFGLRIKFSDPKFKQLLLSTNKEELVKCNYWHDNIWGNCSCEECKNTQGANHLGKLLMKIREELRNDEEKT